MGDEKNKINATELSAIHLSDVTENLIKTISETKDKSPVDDYTKISVSQTASFLALVYEKVRNAIEYREDHLIRRAAIERILKRRLTLNSEAKNEGENLLRELLWARYFPNGSLGTKDVADVQNIIDRYIYLRNTLLTGRNGSSKQYLFDFIFDLITAEIEEFLNAKAAGIEANFSYFIFETLKNKIQIENTDDKQKDTLLYIAIEKAYRKSDRAYQRYHLFTLFYKPLSQYKDADLTSIISKLPSIFQKIDDLISNPTVEKLVRFVRKQLPPYLILFEVVKKNSANLRQLLANKSALWESVEVVARVKYSFIRSRLNNLAVRSIIYIFLTKMLLALLLEVPISQFIYKEVNYIAIGINTMFPPILMLFIILTVTIPGEDNTRKLFERIVEFINKDQSFEKSIALITKKQKSRRPILVLGFTIFYLSTFMITLYLIHLGLKLMYFNLLSEAIFIFFISVVAFFAYRIKQISNMYRLTEKGSILSPLFDFFFMPILSLGKLFSEGLSKINFFILFFDFIIEAPIKLIIEVIEEWITFVRQKKEEIV